VTDLSNRIRIHRQSAGYIANKITPLPTDGVYLHAPTVAYGVFIQSLALDAILRHCYSTPDLEVGGLLLGRLHSSDNMIYIGVHAFIEANYAQEAHTSLVFTPKTWMHFSEQQSRLDASLLRVGWVHTHPNFGLFLSKDDVWIHDNWFQEPWQIAIVVDPIQHTMGAFVRGEDGTLPSEYPSLEAILKPLQSEPTVDTSITDKMTSNDRYLLLLFFILFLLILHRLFVWSGS
jgi:proteasome lid subunit RPN8/RPN11